MAYVSEPLDAAVRLRLDRETADALLASAARNERSLSAEVRLAIKHWLAERVAAASIPVESP